MGIDLFTLIAQIINLLLLLYLLRRFLYLPVLMAVTNRQRMIASELRKAARAEKRASETEAECKQKMQEIEAQKQEILSAAHKEARLLMEKMSEENHKQAQKDRKEWQQRFKAEQSGFENAVQQLVVKHFNIFANSAVKQMADVSLNDLVIRQFKEKILSLSKSQKRDFIASYKNKKLIIIQTAEELNTETAKDLCEFVRKQFEIASDAEIVIELKKELISGLALQADEQLISWNIESYLDDFRRHLSDEVTQLLNRG